MQITSPRTTRTHIWMAVAFTALLGLGLTACGDDDDTVGPDQSTTTTEPDSTGPSSTDDPGSTPPPVPANAEGFSSTYLTLFDDSCTFADGVEDGQDGSARCVDAILGYDLEIGFVGAPGTPQVMVVSADGSYSRTLSACTFNEPGELLEVRRASGRPFAVILRQTCVELATDGTTSDAGEFLVVAGLAGYDNIDGLVDVGTTAGANEVARDIADAGFSGSDTSSPPSDPAPSVEEAIAAAVAARVAEAPCGDGTFDAGHQSTPTGAYPEVVVAVACSTGLRNEVVEIMFFDGGRLVPSGIVQYRDGALVGDPVVVGLISLDPLSVLDTSGAGSCGTLAQYGFVGNDLTLQTVREQPCDDDPDAPYVEPSEWPVVYSS